MLKHTSGELVLTGSGEATIDLKMRIAPERIILRFKDEGKHHHKHAPCDHHHRCGADWIVLFEDDKKHHLTVYWDVCDVRELVWEAFWDTHIW